MLDQILTANLYALMTIFARLGGVVMLMPGVGDQIVSPRVRLLFGLTLSFVMLPLIGPKLPVIPQDLAGLTALLLGEIGIGLFIGAMMRLIAAALETAGSIASLQMGLSSASLLNPAIGEQGTVIGSFLSLTGLVVLFATDLHHLMIRGAVDSYEVFRPGVLPAMGDFSEAAVRTVAASFRIAVMMVAPLLVVPTVMFIALGVMARLMPQMQVFFVQLPLQILVGGLLLSASLVTMMLTFSSQMSTLISGFLNP